MIFQRGEADNRRPQACYIFGAGGSDINIIGGHFVQTCEGNGGFSNRCLDSGALRIAHKAIGNCPCGGITLWRPCDNGRTRGDITYRHIGNRQTGGCGKRERLAPVAIGGGRAHGTYFHVIAHIRIKTRNRDVVAIDGIICTERRIINVHHIGHCMVRKVCIPRKGYILKIGFYNRKVLGNVAL